VAEIEGAIGTATVKGRAATRTGPGVALGGLASAVMATRQPKGTAPLRTTPCLRIMGTAFRPLRPFPTGDVTVDASVRTCPVESSRG
jgi:hypothetical protein